MTDDLNDDQLLNELWKEIQNSLKKLHKVWHQTGYDAEIISRYRKDVINHTKELYLDMVTEAEEKKSEFVVAVEKMIQAIKTLSHELKMEATIPKYQAESLIHADAILKKKLKELELIKENRMSQARILLEKERQLCKQLGLQPVGFKSSIPSNDEIRELELYLSTKEIELTTLKSTFKDLRRSIIKMMEEMVYTPHLDFERLVCHDHHNFIYSSHNMEKLEQLHEKIKDQLSSMKEQADRKRQELLTLWTYLEVPKDKYEEFLAKYSGYDTATVNALNKEIRRCMEIRKENMFKFIGKVREELKNWWDICKFSTKDREAFRFYTSEVYSEDMLKLHEIEVERLRQFYDDNQKLYELLDKREELWDQKKDYVRQTENPDRYHNRGGQLLAEEKARKYLTKNLPKLEEQLKTMVDEFEEKNGRPFTIYGLTLSDYFAKQVEELETEMEKLKAAKIKAKGEKSAKKTPLSNSRRNLAYASIRGVNTSLKRKDRSPLTGVTKSARLANSENVRPKASASKIRRSVHLNKKVKRKLLSSSIRTTKSPQTPSTSGNKTEIIHTDGSVNTTRVVQQYEEFQEHLADRDELRSTLINEFGEGGKLKKPSVRTPVKPSRKHFSPRTPLRKNKTGNSTQLKSPKLTSTPRLAAAPSTSIQNIF